MAESGALGRHHSRALPDTTQDSKTRPLAEAPLRCKRNSVGALEGFLKAESPMKWSFPVMGDTGLETVGGCDVEHGMACLLGFGVLKLAGICSEWNLEWNLGPR